jgi:hypothetical protein
MPVNRRTRSTPNVPDMLVNGWVLNGQSPIRDYVDPQWQFVANAGWTKGSHNVKFR